MKAKSQCIGLWLLCDIGGTTQVSNTFSSLLQFLH